RFEYEAYDVGHLYTLAYYHQLGLVEPPIFLQTIMGVMGGIGPEVEHIAHMKTTTDRLFGNDVQWSVLGPGRPPFNMITASAGMGSRVRVGLEDGLFIGKGRLAESNAEQVAKIVRILGELSLEVATPAEAREILGLKGLDQVGWGARANTRPRRRSRPAPPSAPV